MIDYKKKVLEYYGAEFTTNYDVEYKQQIRYQTLNTADGYSIYNRTDGGSQIFFDEDIWYYAESAVDSIWDDIKEGLRIFVDPEIAGECGFDDDAWQWADEYEKLEELAE